jgi:phenylpropionate dioxygenase-like ring-hydroxylating dioxygenase large terminal subunit
MTMTTKIDNERLTRVGPGTAMGAVLRRFWIPFLLPEELPGPDCPPLRVRLLGEDLIAFRDSRGRIGLLDRYCRHRRVDLFFGRNEECGLRCVYHGWKYDVDGTIVDMPAEPADTPLKREIRLMAYPTVEWGGLIWAYMGDPQRRPPRPPELEWGLVPSDRRFITKRLQETNFVQAVEGGIDSSHVSILHSRLDPAKAGLPFRQRQLSVAPTAPYLASDTAPKFFVRRTDQGLLIGARRQADEAHYYWRITQFLLPFYTMIAPRTEQSPIMGHAWVPIDDHQCWTFTMTWHPERPLTEQDRDTYLVHVPLRQDGSFRPVLGRDEDYGLDRETQRLHSATGIDGIGLQDAAIQESMGPIVDRSREVLGSGDAAIVAFRRRLLAMADDVEAGREVAAPAHPHWYRVRSAGIVLEKGVDFQVGAASRLTVA